MNHVGPHSLERRSHFAHVAGTPQRTDEHTRPLAPAAQAECERPLRSEDELETCCRLLSEGPAARHPAARRPSVRDEVGGDVEEGRARPQWVQLVKEREDSQHSGGVSGALASIGTSRPALQAPESAPARFVAARSSQSWVGCRRSAFASADRPSFVQTPAQTRPETIGG